MIPLFPAEPGLCRAVSAHAFNRILKLARTIVADPAQSAWADLADCDQIETPRLTEAIRTGRVRGLIVG